MFLPYPKKTKYLLASIVIDSGQIGGGAIYSIKEEKRGG